MKENQLNQVKHTSLSSEEFLVKIIRKIYKNSRGKGKPKNETSNFAVIIKRTYKLALFSKISRSSIQVRFFKDTENSKIKCMESLQAFQWNSLKKISIPRKQARIKALIKCRMPSLKILDLCQSFKTDNEGLSRCAINKIESINLPIHKNSKLGSYLALIKICSQKKRELYLNYLKKLPKNQKCMQEMYLQFQMDCLYSQ